MSGSKLSWEQLAAEHGMDLMCLKQFQKRMDQANEAQDRLTQWLPSWVDSGNDAFT